MRKKDARVFAVIGVFLIGIVLCMNFEFISKYPYVESIYNYLSTEIITYRNLDRNLHIQDSKTLPDFLGEFSYKELQMLKERKLIFLDAKQVLRMAAKGLKIRGEVSVLINTPSEYRGLTKARQIAYNCWVTEAALQTGVKVIVDCSIPDLSRLTPQGLSLVQKLKQKKIIRLVIVDGGHHLPAFCLEPELIILPVLKGKNNVFYTSHPLLQDAMSIAKVKMALRDVSPKTVIVTAPRFLILKTKGPLAEMVRQVLKKISAGYWRQIKYKTRKQNMRSAQGLMPVLFDAKTVMKNSSLLMHIDLKGKQDLHKTAKKIAEINAKFKIKRVYLSVGYGKQPWYQIRQKNMHWPEISNIRKALPDMDIQIITIPYATLSLFLLH